MKKYTREMVRRGKRRIEYRLGDRSWKPQAKPMISASNVAAVTNALVLGLVEGTMH